jgi:hypothetical protein
MEGRQEGVLVTAVGAVRVAFGQRAQFDLVGG